ncbi:putative leucine-rich repeat-containing protein DDB_G0290503 isoform X2 [Littorina saxatilis]|uniref:putative leucine-rich repeat-containing protein DDB_G0290503 isoform X2 n=1 Tax=Littorina saxatilis TaxID=31220 RepID=UPI0038B67945
MAAAEQRLLESPTDIHGQISQRLEADGLSPQCGEGEKLLYLWRLYQQLEGDLNKARENEGKLKKAQTEEMKEVENYVEHIRHLSDEREALIQELETENEQLKTDLEQVRLELNGDAQKEASEMLTQQGLGEIAEAIPSEQVAYLLVERARLLDEVDGAQTPASQSAASGGRDSQELKEILEQERKDFEQELSQQRESASMIKDGLRKEHEEEVNALMDENSKLEEELQEVKRKCTQLEKQIERLKQEQKEEEDIIEDEKQELEEERDQAVKEKEQALKEKKALEERVAALGKEKDDLESSRDSLERERKDSLSRESPSTPTHIRPSSPMRSNDVALRKVIEDKTKIEGEMLQLRTQLRSSGNEKEALEEEAQKAKKEAEKFQAMVQQLQVKNKNLRQEMEEIEAQLDEAENQAEDSKKKEEDVSKKFQELQAEVKTLRSEAQRSTTLQDIVDILSNEKSELTTTLDGVRKEMQKVLAEREDLSTENLQLTQDEEQLAKQLASLKEELSVMEKERDDLFVERDELISTQDNQDGMLSTLRTELSTTQEFREKLKSTSEQLEKVNKELHSKLEEATAEVNTLTHTSQELAKQELIVSHLKEQNTGLNNQVTELQSQLEWAHRTEHSLIDSQQTAQKAHTDTEKRFMNEVDDLRVKLQHALTELQAAKTAYEEQVTQKSSLTDQLSLTESRLHEMLEGKSNLEQEVKNKTELEMKVRELETTLDEKSRLADSYDDERKQRLELESKVQELNQEQEYELSTLRTEAQQEKQQRLDLEFKVQELEQMLDDAKVDGDTLLQSMKAKVNSLEIRVQKLQDDLFSAQDEVTALQEKYEQAVSEAEEAKCEMLEQQAQAMDQASQAATGAVSIEEMEASMESAQKQLQDTRNDLNLANTKITHLEEQLTATQSELNKSADVIKAITGQKEIDNAKIEELENSVKSLTRELSESVRSLTTTRSQLKDKQNLLDAVRHEMESLNREMEYLRDTSAGDSEEKSHNRERLKNLDVKVRHLEQENAEMARKLSDSVNQREQLSEKLEKEKLRHTDSHHQSARYVEQLEADLSAANKHIRSLRDELQQYQTSVFKLEADNLGQTAKYESMVSRLEAELKELKQQHRREADNMGEKVVNATAECRDTKTDLREKEQLHLQFRSSYDTSLFNDFVDSRLFDAISELRREVSRAQTSMERLQAQLASESKTRSDVESRNTILEHEMTKVWSQVRMLMERNTNLESAKKLAEEELDRKTSTVRQLESSLSSRESSLQSSIREWQGRAEIAERHEESTTSSVKQLEEDLALMVTKATTAEQQLHLTEINKTEVSEKSHQLASVRNQLEGEKLQRTLLDQTVAELKHQVSLLKQRENKVSSENKDLQHTILDLETRLSDFQERTNDVSTYSFNNMSDSRRQNLMDQITGLQREVKGLQYELLTTSERRDIDLQRYEERKHRTKAKLMKAREYYSLERNKFMEHMRQMDDDLRLTRAALQKELEWKDKMDANYKHLLEEKRDLISQLTEQEEVIRDKSRSLSMLQVRTTYLEDENRHLQQRVDSLSAQKQTLDKLVKDFQHNRDREVAGQTEGQQESPSASISITPVTSHLDNNSADVTWEQDQSEDGRLVFRQGSTFHIPSAVAPSRKSHNHQDLDGFYGQAANSHSDRDLHFYLHNVRRRRDSKDDDLHHRQEKGRSRGDKEKEVVRLYRDKLDSTEEGGATDDDEFEA